MYGEKQKVRALTKILHHAWRQLTKRKDNERQKERQKESRPFMGCYDDDGQISLVQRQLGERAPRAPGLGC